MIDNELLAVSLDHSCGPDFTNAYNAGLVAYFYVDGLHRGTVGVYGSRLDECVAVACWGAALGADQSVWVTGAMYSGNPNVLLDAELDDPEAIPCIAYLVVRRDSAVGLWRRDLSMDDRGRMSAAGVLERRPAADSKLADRALAPWLLDHPDGDADSLAAFLRSRRHYVKAQG